MFNTFFQSQVWQNIIFGNSIKDYAISGLVIIVSFLLFKVLYMYVLARVESLAKRTNTTIDDAVIEILRSFRPPFYIYLAFYVGIRYLTIPAITQKVATAVLIVWIVYQVIISAQIIIDYLFTRKGEEHDSEEARSATSFLSLIIKIIIWTIGVLLVLSNLGVNITSLVAGLGIGGVAVAFALQNILGDLFSSFAIYFDRPFVVGDFIIVGNKMGVVKKIGIKTTRVRALQGEELVFSNRDLTSATIQNFKQMKERRIQFTFGVEYGTSVDKLRKLKDGVKLAVESVEGLRFDRAHFKSFEDSSLLFEVVYYVNSSDYNIYMDKQEEVNLKLIELAKKEKASFAFPTQTIHLEK